VFGHAKNKPGADGVRASALVIGGDSGISGTTSWLSLARLRVMIPDRPPVVVTHECMVDRGKELVEGFTIPIWVDEPWLEMKLAAAVSAAAIRLGATTVVVEVLDAQVEHPLGSTDRLGDLVGSSTAMRRVYPRIHKFAQSMSTVLVDGETGTGKELLARTIHDCSPRRTGPFVVVDCAALPRVRVESELFGQVASAILGDDGDRPGAFEQAHGGTLLLDEVGELPLALQPTLLRALESRAIRRVGDSTSIPVDVRVIASTNRDLRTEVNRRRFRADLFYRLDVLRITLPPLRERPADIVGLATRFWQQVRPDTEPPQELLRDLVQQSWPGNARELRNAIERAALVGHEESPATSYSLAKSEVVAGWERAWIAELLATHQGNVSLAARSARMARSHLRELIARYELQRVATDDDQSTGSSKL